MMSTLCLWTFSALCDYRLQSSFVFQQKHCSRHGNVFPLSPRAWRGNGKKDFLLICFSWMMLCVKNVPACSRSSPSTPSLKGIRCPIAVNPFSVARLTLPPRPSRHVSCQVKIRKHNYADSGCFPKLLSLGGAGRCCTLDTVQKHHHLLPKWCS